MGAKRYSRRRRNKSRRKNRTRRSFRQRGGDLNMGASPITNPTSFDFTAMLEPGMKMGPFGLDAPVEKAQARPHVYWAPPTAGEMYALICWDPDAPEQSYLHWLVINCGGKNPESGETLQDWNGPSPPKDQTHRYYFRVFKQNGKITPPPVNSRTGFNVDQFAQQNGLTALADKVMRVKGV